MMSRLDHALALARLGFRIFPLRPGSKQPYRNEGWKAIATTDAAQIKRWFDTREDMNYAVNCDAYHVVVDLDEGHDKKGRKKQGIANFKAVEDEAHDFAEFVSIYHGTYRVRTPKGGVHLYFVADKAYKNTASTIIPDMDTRGSDGYVVGPGSWTAEAPEENTVEGDYAVEISGEPAALPSWLKTMLDREGIVGERAANAGTATGVVDAPYSIERAKAVLRQRQVAEEGQAGDLHTFATACHVKDEGISEEKCFDLMFAEPLFEGGKTWNEMCEPPWDYSGLETKVHNAYRYGNRQIGAKMDILSAVGAEEIQPAFPDVDVPQPTLAPGEHISAIIQPIGVDEGAKRIAGLIGSVGAFMERVNETESIIPEWMPAQGITEVLAKRGTGKTVLLADMACHIALDLPWNGIAVAPGWSVAYLCGEDDIGFQRQLEAWKREHGAFPDSSRFLIAPAVPNLLDAKEVEMWALELKKQAHGNRVVLFVDTWQRATSHASQNDDKDMSNAFHNVEGLVRYLDGCGVIAFHPPKSNEDTISGSGVIENLGVCIIKITKVGAERKATVTRIKGKGENNYFRFNLKEVEIGGVEINNKPITGVVAHYHGGNTQAPPDEKMANDELLRKAVVFLLRDALPERGNKGMSFNDVADVVAAQCRDRPTEQISLFFGLGLEQSEIVTALKGLFNPATIVALTYGDKEEQMVHIIEGKFVLR